MINKIKNKNEGIIALLLVIMITALTVVSVVVVSMGNISNLMSSYHFSEGKEVAIDMDTCLEDALFRLASSTAISGDYYLNGAGTNCHYQISSDLTSGLRTVTSTASTTSSIGYWEDTVVMQVNVSSTPLGIYSYKNFDMAYDAMGVVSVDSIAPAAISNLTLSNATTDSIDLAWTAPGDDNSTGTATTYDIRYSTSLISEINWVSATQVSGEPSPSIAGSAESMTVSGLSSGTTYYFAIKTSDEVPNTSSISNVPNLATSAGAAVCGNGIRETGEACDYTGAVGSGVPPCNVGPVGCGSFDTGCATDCSVCVSRCRIIIQF